MIRTNEKKHQRVSISNGTTIEGAANKERKGGRGGATKRGRGGRSRDPLQFAIDATHNVIFGKN